MSILVQSGAGDSRAADLRARLVSVFSDVFGVAIDPRESNVQRTSVAEWDSIGHLRLVLELEEAFQVPLPDEEMLTVNSLRDVEAVLARRTDTKREDGA